MFRGRKEETCMNYCDSLFTLDSSEAGKVVFRELDSGGTLTFGQLQEEVACWVGWFRSRGLQPGGVVTLHLHNDLDFIVAHMAAQYMGCVSCLLDPLLQPKSLPYFMKTAGVNMLLTHLGPESVAVSETPGCSVINPDTVKSELSSMNDHETTGSPYDWLPHDTCYIYFTSGTTSLPKAVPLTQANHENFFRIAERYWQPSDHTARHLGFVPFSHGFGSIFLIPWTIRTRAQMYILRSFHPMRVIGAIKEFSLTHIYGVPSHYEQLLRFTDEHETLGSLRMAFCAAAKLEHTTGKRWKATTGHRLHEGYGLIETTGGVIWRVHQDSLQTGHVGRCPEDDLVEVAIMDEEFMPLPQGNEGEIAIRGASVTSGYLNQLEENARVFRDGWFRTGDKGFLTADRELIMTGRIKDIINIAGIKISPFEVETVLNMHEAVENSAVVSYADPLYGEVVKAFVVRRSGVVVSERELIRYASGHLINFQVPKIVEFLDSFPVNTMGKVDRKLLRARS